jgi:hypothetical protein
MSAEPTVEQLKARVLVLEQAFNAVQTALQTALNTANDKAMVYNQVLGGQAQAGGNVGVAAARAVVARPRKKNGA